MPGGHRVEVARSTASGWLRRSKPRTRSATAATSFRRSRTASPPCGLTGPAAYTLELNALKINPKVRGGLNLAAGPRRRGRSTGLAEGQERPPLLRGRSCSGGAGMRPVAEVRQHNGTPTVFLDGKPVFYYLSWPPVPDHNDPQTFQKVIGSMARRTGTHIYTFENGAWRFGGEGAVHGCPGPARGGTVLGISPRWSGNSGSLSRPTPRRAFICAFSSTCASTGGSSSIRESGSSTTKGPSRSNHRLSRLAPRGKRVPAGPHRSRREDRHGRPRGGLPGQHRFHLRVVQVSLNLDRSCGDYSEPMRRYFRSWLRKKYGDDGGDAQGVGRPGCHLRDRQRAESGGAVRRGKLHPSRPGDRAERGRLPLRRGRPERRPRHRVQPHGEGGIARSARSRAHSTAIGWGSRSTATISAIRPSSRTTTRGFRGRAT